VKINKALYGLKQSSHLWYSTVSRFLLGQDYIKSVKDPCVFYKFEGQDHNYIFLYVDDMLMISNSLEMQDSICDAMDLTYGKLTRGLGGTISFLGMRIRVDPQSPILQVDQQEYARKVVEEYHDGYECSGKYPSDKHLFEDEDHADPVDKKAFLSLTMSLMYLATRTRPDIIKEVAWLATKSSGPTRAHMKKLQKILNYVKNTLNYGLIFDGDGDAVEVYADASFGVHHDTSGHTGIVIKLFGSVVLAKSLKQRIITKSSTESELVALDDATTHLPWIFEFLEELRINVDPTAIAYQDNKSTMTLATNGAGAFKRNKHILNRYFWVHRLIDTDVLRLAYLPTELMLADLLTKPLTGERFLSLRKELVSELSTED
jgi:hypothetical protein